MAADVLTFNGVDGDTGGYLYPPAPVAELAMQIVSLPDGETRLGELQRRSEAQEPVYGLVYGPDAENLAEAGWGIVAATDTSAEVLDALKPLCEHRGSQAGDRYRAFTHDAGYHLGEDKSDFLRRQNMGTGAADPQKVPYYLLLVGGPENIPFSFQYALDVQYAVGRVAFDTPEEYARYAAGVVGADADAAARAPGSFRLFGPANPDDPATRLSSELLVEGLTRTIAPAAPAWEVDCVVRDDATKSELASLLWGDNAPDVLFTASHGVGFSRRNPVHREVQGALVCQDWQGPDRPAVGPPDGYYLAGVDVPDDAAIGPKVVFAFACFAAGTPDVNEYAHLPGPGQDAVGDRPFVARLPQRLLSNPAGGALAFVGHVERAWPCSFVSDVAGPQVAVFESTLRSLLDGHRVGHAMEFFNSRYAELSSELTGKLYRKVHYGEQIADPLAFTAMWTANNDARSYVVLGDPAVRV